MKRTALSSLLALVVLQMNFVLPQSAQTAAPGADATSRIPPAAKGSKFPGKRPDVLENGLLGKMRSTRDAYFVPELKYEKWQVGDPYAVLVENYDSAGYYTSSTLRVFREVETIRDKALRELDNHYFAEAGSQTVSIVNFKYDAENGVIFKERTVDSGVTDKTATRYSTDGQTGYDEKGDITWKETVVNHPSGQKIATSYDESGKIVEKTTVRERETIRQNMEYGAVIRETRNTTPAGEATEEWSGDGKTKPVLDKRTVLSTTPNQIVKIESHFRQGEEYLRLVTTYKKQPEIEVEYVQTVVKPHSNADGEPARSYHFKYEYKFDSAGNWTEKTELHRVSKFGKVYFEPFRVVKRDVSYYE